MTEVLGLTPAMLPSADELRTEVRRVLELSAEPLTLSKIRSHLPTAFRSIALEELADSLQRLVDANVLYKYDPYRSQQHRYWDRPMSVHVTGLIHDALGEGPLAWSQLRRKLPQYALQNDRAQGVLDDQVKQGKLYKHPMPGSRSGERYALTPPDPKEPLRQELPALFEKLEAVYKFSRAQLREAAIELLHEEEWASATPSSPPAPALQPPATPAPSESADESLTPSVMPAPHFAAPRVEEPAPLPAADDLP